MDSKAVYYEVLSNLIKEGAVYKKSKFLKEWRYRWMVLTVNYLFTFKTCEYKNPTEVLDLRMAHSIKSYFRKEPEYIGECGFKVSSDSAAYYFRCRSVRDKWAWVMELERTLQAKFSGQVQDRTNSSILRRGCSVENEFVSVEMTERTVGKYRTPYYDRQQPSKPHQAVPRHYNQDYSQERSTSTVYSQVSVLSISTQTVSLEDLQEAIPEPPTASFQTFRKSRRRRCYTGELATEASLRRSRMMRSLFDELKSSSSSKQRFAFYEAIRRLLIGCEGELLEYLALECRVHPAREIFSVMLASPQVTEITSEANAVELLSCINNLSPNIEETFNYYQLRVLQMFILRCFYTFSRKESMLGLILQTIAGLQLCYYTNQDFYNQVKRQLTVLERTVREPELLRRIRELSQHCQ